MQRLTRIYSIIACTCLFACAGSIEKNIFAIYKRYLLQVKPIKSLNVYKGQSSGICFQDSTVTYLTFFEGSSLHFINVETDSVERIVHVPFPLHIIRSYHIPDTSSFAILTDSFFVTYKSGRFNRTYFEDYNDDFIPVNYGPIVFYPEQSLIVSTVITYKYKGIRRVWDYEYLKMYFPDKLESQLVPLKYPSVYVGGAKGIPTVGLTGVDNYLVISLNHYEYVYVVDISHPTRIDSFKVVSQLSKLSATVPMNVSKQELLDALQKNLTNHDEYELAFYNPQKQLLFRNYKPALPVFDSDSNYLSSMQKGLNIVKLDLKNQKTSEYEMPLGQYFVDRTWFYNRYSNKLVNKKVIQDEKDRNFWHYFIHTFTFYDF